MVKLNINHSSKSLHFSQKKKKKLLLNGSILISLFYNLDFIRLTGTVLDGFDLAFNNSLSVTTRIVNKGIINENYSSVLSEWMG